MADLRCSNRQVVSTKSEEEINDKSQPITSLTTSSSRGSGHKVANGCPPQVKLFYSDRPNYMAKSVISRYVVDSVRSVFLSVMNHNPISCQNG